MMEMKDFIVGRRPNATVTYTEVEPEAEEPVGGLAGVRQKGGRWRRITLVCVAMLVVIGVPLFVFTTVKSNKSCSWDYWEPPELIQNDITVLQLVPPSDTDGKVVIFYTMTDISDEVCSTWWYEYDQSREVSYLFYTIAHWQKNAANVSSWHLEKPSVVNASLSQHAYIQSSAIINGNPWLLVEDWYGGNWTLIEVTGWETAASLKFNVNATYTVQKDLSLNLAFSLHTLSDGTVLLLRENDQVTTSEKGTSAGYNALAVTKLPNASPFAPTCKVDLAQPGAQTSTYWWSVGAMGGKDYVNAGYETVVKADNGSIVTQVFSYCELDFTKPVCCNPQVPPWGASANALYWDDAASRVLFETASGECQWYDWKDGSPIPVDKTEDYALQFCSTGFTARPFDQYTWLQPDMTNHKLATLDVPLTVVDEWEAVNKQCSTPDEAIRYTISSVVSLNLGTPNTLLLWVAQPIPDELRSEDEISNWMAYQGPPPPAGTEPDATILQCPCKPNFAVNQCPGPIKPV